MTTSTVRKTWMKREKERERERYAHWNELLKWSELWEPPVPLSDHDGDEKPCPQPEVTKYVHVHTHRYTDRSGYMYSWVHANSHIERE